MEPVIDEREDGSVALYFTELPPVLLRPKIDYGPPIKEEEW